MLLSGSSWKLFKWAYSCEWEWDGENKYIGQIRLDHIKAQLFSVSPNGSTLQRKVEEK